MPPNFKGNVKTFNVNGRSTPQISSEKHGHKPTNSKCSERNNALRHIDSKWKKTEMPSEPNDD